jgi:hypothetical protein
MREAMTIQDYVEANLILKRWRRIQVKKRYTGDLTMEDHKFDSTEFGFGALENIDQLIEKLGQIKEIYGQH